MNGSNPSLLFITNIKTKDRLVKREKEKKITGNDDEQRCRYINNCIDCRIEVVSFGNYSYIITKEIAEICKGITKTKSIYDCNSSPYTIT